MIKNKEIDTNEDNVGLGVDIVDVSRIKKIIDRTPNFIEHTFTEDEIKYCKSSKRWAEHFATHFAAKEAVLKALGTGFIEGVSPLNIEVFHNAKGKPFVRLYDKVKDIADELGVTSIPVSLSFTNTEAVGFAIAINDNSSMQDKVLSKSKDPVAEISRQFKEVKKILDEQN